MRRAPWVLAVLVLLLAGCGGDVSWCFDSGSGAVSAGSDFDDCRPRPDNPPQTLTP
ncbi:MAG TPA: hypothetical protein PKA16_08915 [Ottowia sp.]|uniref:hypothetical protein n=1 Tax=Ottowia sp. TaxID=1898956 RepID=UPI002C4DC800|nr:hypothetical protein [Ottowia sp.]HMN21502.1 hypothetical protein [Ottowia sp.]